MFLDQDVIFDDLSQTNFIIGKDLFEDVQINSTETDEFWYFKNAKKGLIKRFILEETQQTQRTCIVTLIKKNNDKFTPRFDFQIWNKTKKACSNYSKKTIDDILIKARVNLNSCHGNFLLLLNFIKSIEKIEFVSETYAVIEKSKKDIFDNISKEKAITEFSKTYGSSISEKDISLLQNRRSTIEYFKNLMDNEDFFIEEKIKLSEGGKKNIKNEFVWQNFFENNSWIFGYGLQLVSCEELNLGKLEQTVVGNDIIDGSGKRIDALLKTKGSISKLLLCELKLHHSNLLIEKYDRPDVYVPGKELRGAVAQVQKTIHKLSLKVHESVIGTKNKEGNPTGEELLFVKPRGIVVIGKLDDFKTPDGINQEKLASFELYRQQISGIEILTYDELYERVKFIVEKE